MNLTYIIYVVIYKLDLTLKLTNRVFFYLQFENARDILAHPQTSTLHLKSIVVPDLQLLENAEETYPKNLSKSLKSGCTITGITLIQVTEKKSR